MRRRRLRVTAALAGVMLLLGTSAASPAASAPARWMITDLGTLGGKQSWATAINRLGQIVGYSDTADGQSHKSSG